MQRKTVELDVLLSHRVLLRETRKLLTDQTNAGSLFVVTNICKHPKKLLVLISSNLGLLSDCFREDLLQTTMMRSRWNWVYEHLAQTNLTVQGKHVAESK